MLQRYFVNIGIDDITIQLVDRAYQAIRQCEQRCKASTQRKVYTGRRRKPALDIKEEQLIFLLEQGFHVGEISHMLGVGKERWNVGCNHLG